MFLVLKIKFVKLLNVFDEMWRCWKGNGLESDIVCVFRLVGIRLMGMFVLEILKFLFCNLRKFFLCDFKYYVLVLYVKCEDIEVVLFVVSDYKMMIELIK